MTCESCNGTDPLCPHCDVTRVMPRLKLVPLVAEPPTETISALIGCIVSTHGQVRPRLCDPDEATIVELKGRAQ